METEIDRDYRFLKSLKDRIQNRNSIPRVEMTRLGYVMAKLSDYALRFRKMGYSAVTQALHLIGDTRNTKADIDICCSDVLAKFNEHMYNLGVTSAEGVKDPLEDSELINHAMGVLYLYEQLTPI